MSWFKVTLTSSQVSSGEMISIQNEFKNIFDAQGAPKDMALFALKEARSQDEFSILYFSPSSTTPANALISAYNGTPCGTPEKGESALLVGHADAWDLLA